MDDANVLGSPAPAENRGGRWILEISGSNRTVVGFQKSDTILQGPTFMVVPRLYFPTQLEFFFPLQSPRWTKNFLFFLAPLAGVLPVLAYSWSGWWFGTWLLFVHILGSS